jgi:hypothetical protein
MADAPNMRIGNIPKVRVDSSRECNVPVAFGSCEQRVCPPEGCWRGESPGCRACARHTSRRFAESRVGEANQASGSCHVLSKLPLRNIRDRSISAAFRGRVLAAPATLCGPRLRESGFRTPAYYLMEFFDSPVRRIARLPSEGNLDRLKNPPSLPDHCFRSCFQLLSI